MLQLSDKIWNKIGKDVGDPTKHCSKAENILVKFEQIYSRLDVEDDKTTSKMHFLLSVVISLGSVRTPCKDLHECGKVKINPNFH